ncbi:hypothetical protein PBOI14_48390 [Pseudomonas sp. Boi14]|nr:hypothetical protein PBOI14_48390 [Pseudomonas sp. Boi14]
MPMSTRRVTAPMALLVCRVESTRCPVREACTAISAVSRSRISPTITTSGSWRRMARKPRAKVMSTLALTWVWPIPVRWYSTGSSMVRMLRSRLLRLASPAYSVVVLPEPVGPVTRRMPWGLCRAVSRRWRTAGFMPRCARSRRPACLSSRRITTRSPWLEGRVETRTSTSCPAMRKAMRPSWGMRFSAMSSLAMTLIRDTSRVASSRRGRSTSRSRPSTRRRTERCSSNASRCTSEALLLTASLRIALIRRMIGASSSCSIRSVVFGNCSARLERSNSSSNCSPRPSATCLAPSWPSR